MRININSIGVVIIFSIIFLLLLILQFLHRVPENHYTISDQTQEIILEDYPELKEVSFMYSTDLLIEFYKKRDNLLNDSFDDWMMDMATLGLSDRIPFLGSVADLAVSVKSGSADDSYSAVNDMIDETSLGENELIQKVIDSKSLDALAKTTDAVTGYFSSKEEIEQLIKEHNNEKRRSYFYQQVFFSMERIEM